MTIFYNIFFIIFSIVYLPTLLLKGKAHKAFMQRFGILPEYLKGEKYDAVWIHAVSVGEVLGAKVFVKKLEELYPGKRIIVSTTTKTGQDMANKTFSKNIKIFYFPVDLSFVVLRVIQFIKPQVFFIMETELWPNTINIMASKKIPVILINGRISDKSFNGYKIISPILKGVFNNISLFLMQTENDKNRIITIGADASKVKVIGNIKYDEDVNPEKIDKKSLGFSQHDDIFIAGSTHPGEEEIVLECYKKLKKKFKNLRLIIAPRHIERVGEIQMLVQKNSLTMHLMSKEIPDGYGKDVFILDVMGKLGKVYSVGDVIFVGGSLIKKGGHNIIEPARYSRAIIFGQYMNNFRDMSLIFLKTKSAIMVHNETEMEEVLSMLLSSPDKRAEMGRNAKVVVEQNKGACDRLISIAKGYIK